MAIIYNGTDISNSVHPLVLQLTDNAGGVPDSITASFADSDGLWSKWKPAKGDTIQVTEGGFNTGQMFVDDIVQHPGVFQLMALSTPQQSKTARSQAWEKVRLFEIGSEIAARYGFTFRPFNVTNHLYDRVDQVEEDDFSFFAFRCMLEGYALKIHDKSLVVYDESSEEQKPVDPNLAVIRERMMSGRYKFQNKSTGIYQTCEIRSQLVDEYIKGEYTAPGIYGPTKKENLFASNQAEANRWAKGLLRFYNKLMITGSFTIDLNTNYASATKVNVQEIGMFDGDHFIHRIIHDLLRNQSILTVRKPLEGY